MTDPAFRTLLRDYQAGGISRRQLLRSLLSLGLAMPVAAGLVQACAPTSTVPSGTPAVSTPTRRGGGGTLRLLSYLGIQQLNPHHNIQGLQDESRLAAEPLGALNAKAEVVPILGADRPSIDGGTVDPNGKWVIWRLKKDVVWHDEKPFTADDVVFTWEYVADSATGASSRGNYTNVDTVEKIDDHQVKITFKDPTPVWYTPFVGPFGTILPKHILASYKGQNARNAPYGRSPIGTGPYRIVEIRSDLIIAELNEKYHVVNRPFFDRVEFKSGAGDPVGAARAVLQTGEFDATFNLQTGVENEMLRGIERGGSGKVVVFQGLGAEHLQLNQTDPNREVDGERSSIKSKHPFFSDPQVRRAMQLAFDRKVLAEQLGPPGSTPAIYMGMHSDRYLPEGGSWKYDPKQANDLLDRAGWRRGSDGLRAKDGVPMKVLYATTVSPLRQKIQAVVKKDLEALGVQVELKALPSTVFFATDPTVTESWLHFRADIQQYASGPFSPDPQQYFGMWLSSKIPQQANRWAGGTNNVRFQNAEYDRLWTSALTEMDEAKRTATFKRITKLLNDDGCLVPLFYLNGVAATSANLRGHEFSPWDSRVWNIAYWDRTP